MSQYTKKELDMFALGKRERRSEVIEELKTLLGLDKCPHCEHEEGERS